MNLRGKDLLVKASTVTSEGQPVQGHHRSSKSGEQMRNHSKAAHRKVAAIVLREQYCFAKAQYGTPEIIRGIALPALKNSPQMLSAWGVYGRRQHRQRTLTAQRPWLRHAPHSLMSHDVLSRALKQCRRLPAVLAQSFRCVCSFLLWLEKNNQNRLALHHRASQAERINAGRYKDYKVWCKNCASNIAQAEATQDEKGEKISPWCDLLRDLELRDYFIRKTCKEFIEINQRQGPFLWGLG